MHTHTNGNGKGGCGCGGTLVCEGPGMIGLERTHFFPRQLIGPDELTQDQIYFRDKVRRHNRLLHGWGIVCGARVKGAKGCEVVVEPGYILGPQGDEIVVPEEVTVDLCREDADGNAFSPCGDVDPWCREIRVDRSGVVYLCICYAECSSRPVRIAVGCGCDEAECEYSRTRDSYELKVLTELPQSFRPMPPPARDHISCLQGQPRVCPPCPADCCVILADITIRDGEVVRIDCSKHRRYVASFAGYFFLCGTREKYPGGESPWDRPTGGGLVEVGSHLGYRAMADTAASPDEEPRGSVALRLRGGELAQMPAYFSVRRDDTFGSLLEREGTRTLEDLETGDMYTLGDLYAIAGVDPAQLVGSTMEALAPLEGLDVSAGDLAVVRESIGGLLDAGGIARLEREHAGAPAAAVDLPATDLDGVAARSTLGKHLKNVMVGELAAMDPDELTAKVVEGVPAARKEKLEEQVRKVHAAAVRVAKLTGLLGGREGEDEMS
jgi:hypothetical protein